MKKEIIERVCWKFVKVFIFIEKKNIDVNCKFLLPYNKKP